MKLHRATITAKLQVRSVAELTRLAQAAGLFDEPRRPSPKGNSQAAVQALGWRPVSAAGGADAGGGGPDGTRLADIPNR